jgi:hypothetical protein
MYVHVPQARYQKLACQVQQFRIATRLDVATVLYVCDPVPVSITVTGLM